MAGHLSTPERAIRDIKRKAKLQPSGCVEWQGSKDRKGYGQKRYRTRLWSVHRLIWTLLVAPIPEGMDVCHKCDNPPCLRLEHLFIGTRSENMADMRSKGRGRNQFGPWQ